MQMTPNQLRKVLGENIRLRRRELQISQVELAESCQVTQAFISQLEAGKTSVTLDTLAPIAEALRMAPSVLLGEHALAASA
jgi:transcriptional regulator with XRE-family HTH domain